jgi:hypothetical protein
MTMRAAAACAAIGLLVAGPAAGAQQSADTRAGILLTLPSSARGLALGDGWTAIADDESAVFFNPAQLARLRAPAFGGSVQRYIAGTTLGAIAVAAPFRRGTIGLGLQLLDYGSEDEVVASAGTPGTVTGNSVSAQDVAFTLAYGEAFGARRQWRAGAAAEVVREHVANVSGSAVAASVGAAYTTATGWELSGALQHAGSRLTLAAVSAPLPYTWRASVAAPIVSGVVGDHFSFRPMVEARQASGGPATGVVAAEGTWRTTPAGPVLVGRVGYAIRGTGDDRVPLTAGGGVSLGRIVVDYAYEGFTLLGATHRVGVRVAPRPAAP